MSGLPQIPNAGANERRRQLVRRLCSILGHVAQTALRWNRFLLSLYQDPPPVTLEEVAYRIYAAHYVIPPDERRGLTHAEMKAMHNGQPDPRLPGLENDRAEIARHQSNDYLTLAIDGRSAIARLQGLEEAFRQHGIEVWSICRFARLLAVRQAQEAWTHQEQVRIKADCQYDRMRPKFAPSPNEINQRWKPIPKPDLQQYYERQGGALFHGRDTAERCELLANYDRLRTREISREGAINLCAVLAFVCHFRGWDKRYDRKRRAGAESSLDLLQTLHNRMARLVDRRSHTSA